jgi:hypothetical protein
MNEGKIIGEMDIKNASQEEIMKCIVKDKKEDN